MSILLSLRDAQIYHQLGANGNDPSWVSGVNFTRDRSLDSRRQHLLSCCDLNLFDLHWKMISIKRHLVPQHWGKIVNHCEGKSSVSSVPLLSTELEAINHYRSSFIFTCWGNTSLDISTPSSPMMKNGSKEGTESITTYSALQKYRYQKVNGYFVPT